MTAPLQRSGQFAGTLTKNGSDPHFDLVGGYARINCTFSFTLVDGITGAFIRTLKPIADSVPTLTHDTTRKIMRQVSGFALGQSDTAVLNTIRQRVLISMVMADGTTYPLGRYMFSTNTAAVFSSGNMSAQTLLDESFIVDQPLQSSFPGVGTPGSLVNCGALITEVATLYPTIDLTLDGTPYGTANTWSFGTSGMQVLGDLANFGDYFPPWVGNDTNMHVIRSFDPAKVIPDFDWDRYPHVYADTVTATDDLLSAPNRFIVVGNSTSGASAASPIVGTYDIPATAPHSIQNRGFVVPFIQQLQIDTAAQARAVATAYGIRNTVYQRTTLTTFPDARHDSYNVIRWQGVNWMELGWSMPLMTGASMTHTLRKTYS